MLSRRHIPAGCGNIGEGDNRMHILMYRWKAYNYRDIEQTFRLLGHTVDNIEQELGSYDVSPEFERVIGEKMCQVRYDMVFTVNYFALISNVCDRLGVKYVSWTCDNPLISMYHESVFHSCNYIFTFDRTNYLEFRGMGVEHIWYLPLAVDVQRIDHILQNAVDLKLYQNEISLVGSLYERNTYDRIIPTLPQYLKGYFDCAIEAQMNISGGNLIEQLLTDEILQELEQYYHLEKTERSFSDLRLIFATTVLGLKVAKEQRRSCLLELAKKHQVSIYTNSNTQDLLRVDYRGSVDYWTQMPKVFYGSRINLNLTIPNIKTGIPLRVWDVLGAGGFLMTNYQPELELYFDLDKDLAVFENKRELERKAAYYLEHEKERLEIARNGHEKVKQFHSYEKRMAQMMEILEQEEFPGRGA